MHTLPVLANVRLPNDKDYTTTVRYGKTPTSDALFDLLDVLVAAFGECNWREGTSIDGESKRENWRREWGGRKKVIEQLTTSMVCGKDDFVELEWDASRGGHGELRYRIGATPHACIAYLKTQIKKHSPRKRVERVQAVLARLQVAKDQKQWWRPNPEECVGDKDKENLA